MEMLQVKGNQIVNAQGQPIRLRGTCVGGWMNLEDFINGYPGAEHGLRETLADALGAGKAQFFFDRLADYFFAEDDITFIKSCGATVVRLPLNYRRFESDAEPFRYLESGFARLDRVVNWCAQRGLHVILDLHSVQGWQNTDWHCDNASRHTLFWTQRQFQDRFVALWEEFARRYKGNATIAGYNVMNEPITNAPRGRLSSRYTPNWEILNHVYRRVVNAIRAIDPAHIIFLEGDNFSKLFLGLDAPFADNVVYSSHNYTPAGFGPGAYPGKFGDEEWNHQKQAAVFRLEEGTRFTQKHNVPLWVGEFGSVYNGAAEEIPDRLRALDDEIDVFEEYGAHWTTWTYKDVGVMGWVELDPDCEYLQRIARIKRAKLVLDTDFWMKWLPAPTIRGLVREMARYIEESIGDLEIEPQVNETYLKQAALSGYVGTLMQPAYAQVFKGMSESEIDRVLQSFTFKNCKPRMGLIGIIRKYIG